MSTVSFSQGYIETHGSGDLAESVVQATVDEVIRLAQPLLNSPPIAWRIVDLGCGRGQYSAAFARLGSQVTAIEPFEPSFAAARERLAKLPRTEVHHAEAEKLDLAPNSIDLALSLTTVEHMRDARAVMECALRWLKPGGVLYLTAPNKLWPIECHYKIPFLSWMPLTMASGFLRILGRGDSYEDCSYSRTYWGMRSLFKGLPCSVEFVVPDPDASYLGCGAASGASTVTRLGIFLIRRFPIFWTISKGFIMIVHKDAAPSPKELS